MQSFISLATELGPYAISHQDTELSLIHLQSIFNRIYNFSTLNRRLTSTTIQKLDNYDKYYILEAENGSNDP